MAGLEATRIHGNLYQGSMPPSDVSIRAAGFDVLVLCAAEHQDPDNEYDVDHVIRAPGEDNFQHAHMDSDQRDCWIRAAREVCAHLQAGRSVLVTCFAGLNRSGFVSAYALHLLTGWSGERCIMRVRERRYGALFNRGFVRTLKMLPSRT